MYQISSRLWSSDLKRSAGSFTTFIAGVQNIGKDILSNFHIDVLRRRKRVRRLQIFITDRNSKPCIINLGFLVILRESPIIILLSMKRDESIRPRMFLDKPRKHVDVYHRNHLILLLQFWIFIHIIYLKYFGSFIISFIVLKLLIICVIILYL